MYLFGSGVMTITPLNVVNATPVNIGLLQEISINVKRTIKELYGQYADPLAIGAGTRSWSGKAKIARLGGQALNALLVGGTIAAGYTSTAIGEALTVPATSTYTLTPANAATFVADQGVVYAATGVPLKNVASVSAIGQYSYVAATGVYTFNVADASAKVLISYTYTVATLGQTLPIPSLLIGQPLVWAGNFSGIDPTNGTFQNWTFNNCVTEDLTWGTKLEDFSMPDISFKCFVNAAGSIGQANFVDKL